MITEVIVPVLDQTTTEVRLVNWIKNEGHAVISGAVSYTHLRAHET